MSVRIAAAAPAQLGGIVRLERACFTCPRESGMIAASLGDFLVALDGDELCGYGDYLAVLDEGYMGNLAVAESRRGAGVGGALLDALLARGRESGLAFLTLEVRESNAPARALYAGRGFQSVGRRKKYYEKPVEDAILMTYFFKKGPFLC